MIRSNTFIAAMICTAMIWIVAYSRGYGDAIMVLPYAIAGFFAANTLTTIWTIWTKER